MNYWPDISDELRELLDRKPITEGSANSPDWNTRAVVEEILQFVSMMRRLEILPLASWIELLENKDVLERLANFQNIPLLTEFLNHINANGKFLAFLKEAVKLRQAARDV